MSKTKSNQIQKVRICLIGILLLKTALVVATQADWLCTEESSQRRGNQILSCGIGIALDEQSARSSAFENARTEFSNICATSSDCKGHSVIVSPKRTSCDSIGGKAFKCYRLIAFEITNKEASLETGLNANSSIESADASDVFDRAAQYCTEHVFNKTLGLDPGQIIRPNCVSHSASATPYNMALISYKRGVMFGYCSLFSAELQGALDAIADFKLSPIGVEKLQSGYDSCKLRVQKDRENALGSLGSCLNFELVAGIIDVGKECGDAVFWDFSTHKYSAMYRKLCMSKLNNKEKCSKMADKAFTNYLLKKAESLKNNNPTW